MAKGNSTNQLYLRPKYKGLGNAMNYLKDYVIYYNDWLDRNFAFYRINHFRKALWITTTQKDMTGDGYSLTLITVMI